MRNGNDLYNEHGPHIFAMLLIMNSVFDNYFRKQENDKMNIEGTLNEIKELEVPWILKLWIVQPDIIQGKSNIFSNNSDSCRERKNIVQCCPALLLQ